MSIQGNDEYREYRKLAQLAYELVERKGKVSFIIGAGASATARPKIPLAREIQAEIIEALADNLKPLLAGRGQDITDLSMESLLSLYIEFFKYEDAAYDFLRPRFSDVQKALNYKPPLSYGALAQFLSHGLANYIISWNWDELLERALDDEIGRSNYERVVSISDFRRLLDYKLIGKLEKILFKPHGTISLAATLRYKWDDVQRFENEKDKVLSMVLHDCLIIFAGCSLSGPDEQAFFQKIALEGKLKGIYFVHRRQDFLEKNYKVKSLLRHNRQSDYENYFIIMETCDKFFRKLGKAIYETDRFFDEELKKESEFKEKMDKVKEKGRLYPKLHRHRIRDIFFESNIPPDLKNKLMVELIIFAMKTRGKFKGKTLLGCEKMENLSGEFYQLENKNLYPKALLDELVVKGILIREEDQDGEPGEEVYYCPGISESDMVNRVLEKIPSLRGLERFYVPKESENKLKDLMVKLTEDLDWDIWPAKLMQEVFSFRYPHIITDQEKLEEISLKMLQEENLIRIIAETGEWLTRSPYQELIKGKELQIIISDPKDHPQDTFHKMRAEDVLERLKNFTNQGNKVFIRCIKWEDNKHHMTLGKRNAIYFFRERKSPSVVYQ